MQCGALNVKPRQSTQCEKIGWKPLRYDASGNFWTQSVTNEEVLDTIKEKQQTYKHQIYKKLIPYIVIDDFNQFQLLYSKWCRN